MDLSIQFTKMTTIQGNATECVNVDRRREEKQIHQKYYEMDVLSFMQLEPRNPAHHNLNVVAVRLFKHSCLL